MLALLAIAVSAVEECPACSALFTHTTRSPSAAPLRTAEIVVAHCFSQTLDSLRVIDAALAGASLDLRRVSIYSKCGRVPERPTLRVPVSVSVVPNVGRNDQTYAAHFAEHYDELADVVLLVKDTHFDERDKKRGGRETVRPQDFPLLLQDLNHSRNIACGRSPSSRSVWFWRENLWAFRIAGYDPTTASANFSASAVNMGAFLQATLAPEEYSRLAAETMLPVCTGGTFLCRASSVTSVQRETWRRLAHALARFDNLEEGHFMERTWSALLSPPFSTHPLAKEFLLGAAASAPTEADRHRAAHNDKSRRKRSTRAYLGAVPHCNCSAIWSGTKLHA